MSNNYVDLLIELTRKEIKIRYKNSYLGYLWSIANPLLLAMIFYFVFKTITRIDVPNYALFLVAGLLVWQWMSNTIQTSTMLFVGNAPLIKKVNFPRNFLAMALVFSEAFNFFFSIVVIAGFMLYHNVYPSLQWIFGVPLLFLITGLFVYGLSLLIGTINLFFRDLERIVMVFMTFLFYATPILYPLSMVPAEYYSYIVYANPFTVFVLSWKDLFLNGVLNFGFISVAIIYAFLAYLIGSYSYKKLKFKFAELI